MKHVHLISVEIQKRSSTIADCRLALDVLIDTIERKKNFYFSAFYKSGLTTHYIDLDSERSPDVAFEISVVKPQRGQQEDLTDAE